MNIVLQKLPYKYDALEPVISEEIMMLHHDKHHQSYVNGTNLALQKLKEIRQGKQDSIREVIRDLNFNYNGHILHSLFWRNMRPIKKNNFPEKNMLDLINLNFGSFDIFKNEFTNIAKTVEGSGWAVLVKQENKLLITQIEKHNMSQLIGFTPLLALDVWEHAYYPQYFNKRGDYINNWWKVVNWKDVESRI